MSTTTSKTRHSKVPTLLNRPLTEKDCQIIAEEFDEDLANGNFMSFEEAFGKSNKFLNNLK
jgi:hypothetical protein